MSNDRPQLAAEPVDTAGPAPQAVAASGAPSVVAPSPPVVSAAQGGPLADLRPSRSRVLRDASWAAHLAAIGATAAMYALLWRLVFAGWAHSYDSAIYTRSLWGMAHGHLYNPMVELHSLSIHGNFLLFALAPIAWFLHPAQVLALAQSLAFGATVWLVADDAQRVAVARRRDPWFVVSAALLAGIATTIGAPVVLNPFLFDVRPDLIAVPLLTAGLLRARRAAAFDRFSVGLMLAALLVREETMMVIVGAMTLAPMPRPWTHQLRLRLGVAAAAVGWWALYWFGFRQWIGDGSYEIAQNVASAFGDETHLGLGATAAYKLEIIAAALIGGGGLTALGWRWLGPAIPGLLFLLLSSRMQPLILNFHYVLFATPGVLVAFADGWQRLIQQRWRSARPTLAVAACVVAAYATSSAAPGGGRFRAGNFYLGLDTQEAIVELDQLAEAHALIASIPSAVGVAAPHELAAPIADRDLIMPFATYATRVTPDAAPPGVDWVAVPRSAWASTGRTLVEWHDFRLVGTAANKLALLTRDPAVAAQVPAVDVDCSAPLGSWPSLGLELCAARRLTDGRVAAAIRRTESVDTANTPLVVAVVIPDGAADFARCVDGLVSPGHLPRGVAAVFVSEHPAPESGALQLAVATVDGHPVPARTPGSATPLRALPITP
ncbi:MAG: DUF2079 domain-containing protein [Myxococcales bacterium]|nr:DUF2079 domain-containing protein [Myxococcales bacterium]MCB9532516.1 DUF2079 domain-containing protein [Myxococcales bacterium]MCB9533120.1 DUF2079 domain-containing protein [Myxococcales bacterium]